jgi:hypothetical protein
MKMTMTTYQVADALVRDLFANWSIAGASALAKHFEQLEEETGDEIDFNATEIRCDWSEYVSLIDCADDYYGTDRDGRGWKWHLCITEDMGEDEIDEIIRERIRESGELIEFDEGVIVSSF